MFADTVGGHTHDLKHLLRDWVAMCTKIFRFLTNLFARIIISLSKRVLFDSHTIAAEQQ
jgi:hypothetical protein